MQRGKLIVIEGPDGSGKSDLVAGLKDMAADFGMPVTTLREPGGTALGETIRTLVKDASPTAPAIGSAAEALLFCAARAQLVDEVIVPTLQRGEWIIMDRFEWSTVIYQGQARGLGADRVRMLSQFATDGLQPDLTIVLSVTAQTARTRRTARGDVDADRLDAESDLFHQTVVNGYESIVEHDTSAVKIDANGSHHDVLMRTFHTILRTFDLAGG
jgi:dTMP kinase